MHLQPDTLLQGRYRVVRLIAQGGMGAVYEAVDTRLGSTVALKQTLMADPALREAFEREARLLAALQHPALPVVSDHFGEGGGQFLVMQFIPGDDLASLLKARGAPFPPDQVLAWAGALLDALAYLHGRTPPVIHRDIKPQNLKLAPHGGIILLDFGLAKGVAAGQTGPSPSLFGYTPQYAPIEQIQGSGTDARSDLYSLAATLAELLTGAPPPDALTRVAATVRGLPDPLRPIIDLNPNVSSHTSAAIQRSLALNPAMRHPTAAAMRADLLSAAQALATPRATGSSSPAADLGPALGSARQPATGPTVALGAADPTGGAATAATGSTIAVGPAVARRALPGGLALAAIVLALVLVSAVATFIAARGAAPSTSSATAVPASTTVGRPTAGVAADPEGPGSSRANPLTEGNTVAVDGWKVDVLEMVRGEPAYEMVRKANANNREPPPGMEYLLLKLRAVATAPAPYAIGRGDVQVIGARDVAYGGFGSYGAVSSTVPPAPAFGETREVNTGDIFDGWAVFLVGADEPDLVLAVGSIVTGAVRYVALTPGARFEPDLALLQVKADRLGRDWREPAGLGETVVTDDWEVTVLEVERGEVAWERILKGNQFNERPAEGMEYVAAYVRVRRIADFDDPDLLTASYFTGTVGPEEVEQPSVVVPPPALGAELFPGGTAEGWVVVTIPAGTADARLVFQNNTVFFEPDSFNTRYFAIE